MRSNKKLVKEKSSTVPLTLSDIRPTGQYIYYIMIFLLSTLNRASGENRAPTPYPGLPSLAINKLSVNILFYAITVYVGTGTVFYSTVHIED